MDRTIWAAVQIYPKILVEFSIILYIEICLKRGAYFINFILRRTKHYSVINIK